MTKNEMKNEVKELKQEYKDICKKDTLSEHDFLMKIKIMRRVRRVERRF